MIRFTTIHARFAAGLTAAVVLCLVSACTGTSQASTQPTNAPVVLSPTPVQTTPAAKATAQSPATAASTTAAQSSTGGKSTPATNAPSSAAVLSTKAATTAATAGTPAALAALINDKIPITMDQLNAEVTRDLDARKSLGDPPPADMKAFKDTILESLIQGVLIEQAATIQGITVTDQEVETEIQAEVQAAGGHDKWLAQIAADHMTEAEYRANLKSALITGKIRDLVTANVGNTAEQVHARHILVADLATAQQILQQLKSGADFAALAAKYSLDVTTKQTGGDLGWFTRGQLLQKTVEDAAFNLPVNQFSAPVKSDLGYHIIQTLEKVSNRPIDAATRARIAQQTFEAWYQTVRNAAKVVKYI